MTDDTRLPQNTARFCGPYKPSIRYGDLELMQAPFSWNAGGRFGSPELVKQILQQQLQDGEIVTSDRASNRTIDLTLTIRTSDLGAAAIAEADLVAESIKPRNTLVFDPGDGSAPVTVFDTFPADLVHERDDTEESFGVRTFGLEIPALPYARSKDLVLVTVEAPPVSGVTETVDDGSSTTGWSGVGAPVTTTGSRVQTALSASVKSGYLERTGLAVSMADTPYLQVIAGSGTAAPAAVLGPFYINGSPATVIAQSGTTYWLDASGIVTLNSLRIDWASSGNSWIWCDDITRTNTLVATSTGRQNARQVEVSGSARAIASLSLSDETDALGEALIYTTSETDSVQPPLREYLVTGPTITPDGTTVSGATSPLTTDHDFDLPASGVPAAGYLLLARVKHASTGTYTVDWAAASRMGATVIGDTQAGSVDVDLTAGTWEIITVALMNLPPTALGSDGVIRVSLSSSDAITLDEAWLFDLDHGRLTWVDCGSTAPTGGGASNRLWLDTATTADPKPSIWRGTDSGRTDAVHGGPDAKSWGAHEFKPPVMNVFTVTTASEAAELSLSYYPAWHSHAAL